MIVKVPVICMIAFASLGLPVHNIYLSKFYLLNFQFSFLQTTNVVPVDRVKLYGAGRAFLGRR